MAIKADRKIDEHISLALPSFDAVKMMGIFADFITNILYETDYCIIQCDIHINNDTKPCTIIATYDGNTKYKITVVIDDIPMFIIGDYGGRVVRDEWIKPHLIPNVDNIGAKEYLESFMYYIGANDTKEYDVDYRYLRDELLRIFCFNYLTYDSTVGNFVANNADKRIYGIIVPIYYEQ